MKGEPAEYTYRTNLRWTGERKGILGSEGKPALEVACGPEFGGHEGYWNPEDLFVAAVEHCTMSTFLWLAEKRRVGLISYESEAEGLASMSEGSLRFTRVVVRPRIRIFEEADRTKVQKCLVDIRGYCLVFKSVTADVVVDPVIVVEDSTD
jgi:organic hydroperoxide reductase OsmC/OhrA